MSQQLTFQGTLLSTTLHNNSIYFTASELAKALQYKFTDAVTKIYNRNQDEFTSEMSLTVKMTVKGYGNGNSEKEVRIFSLRGAHLIAMFSKTPVAKAFRKWVLDILDKEIEQQSHKTTTNERTGLRQAVSQLVSKKGINYSQAYAFIHQRFNVNHIDEIAPEQLNMAVEYVHKLYLDGELIIPNPEPAYTITDMQLSTLSIVINQFVPKAEQFAKKVGMVHRTLFSLLELPTHRHNQIGAEAYDLSEEFHCWTKEARNIIANLKHQQDEHLNQENFTNFCLK